MPAPSVYDDRATTAFRPLLATRRARAPLGRFEHPSTLGAPIRARLVRSRGAGGGAGPPAGHHPGAGSALRSVPSSFQPDCIRAGRRGRTVVAFNPRRRAALSCRAFRRRSALPSARLRKEYAEAVLTTCLSGAITCLRRRRSRRCLRELNGLVEAPRLGLHPCSAGPSGRRSPVAEHS